MKNPELITDAALQQHVTQACYNDISFGPINDAIRSAVGLEYENKLISDVTKLNIPYLLEGDLQKRGYDKTPDVKLEIPILVKSHTVCWIESKASFGDEKSHKQYLREQYYSYWNRFGPGLVIYWFDYIEELSNDMKEQGILLMNRFPTANEITFYNPKLIKTKTAIECNAFTDNNIS